MTLFPSYRGGRNEFGLPREGQARLFSENCHYLESRLLLRVHSVSQGDCIVIFLFGQLRRASDAGGRVSKPAQQDRGPGASSQRSFQKAEDSVT